MGLNDATSEIGSVTAESFKTNWLFHEIGRLEWIVSKLPLRGTAFISSNFIAICKTFLRNYQRGAMLRPVWANVPFEYIPAPNREDVSRILVVICCSNDLRSDDVAWEWKGVHEWDPKEPLPRFINTREILFV